MPKLRAPLPDAKPFLDLLAEAERTRDMYPYAAYDYAHNHELCPESRALVERLANALHTKLRTPIFFLAHLKRATTQTKFNHLCALYIEVSPVWRPEERIYIAAALFAHARHQNLKMQLPGIKDAKNSN